MIEQILQRLRRLPRKARRLAIAGLSPADQAGLYLALRYDWSLWSRPNQRPPSDSWRYWFLVAGRGAGKTRPAAELVIEWAKEPETRIGLVSRDAGAGRKVMVDGESGILASSPPWFRPRYLPSLKRLVWPNGSLAELHSAGEPDTLRGPQYHKVWAEELFHWPIPPKTHPREPIAWTEGLRYGLRLGDNPQAVITSTPRTSEFCHDLLLGRKDDKSGARTIQQLPDEHPDRCEADGFPMSWTHETKIEVDGEKLVVRAVVARWPTEENRANLSPGKPEEWRAGWGSSRLKAQELDGAILAKAQGSLWSTEVIDQHRVHGIVPRLAKTLVGIDPTRSNSPTDECGIVVGGLSDDGHAYVWDDVSLRASPDRWASVALAAHNKYGAEAIVIETNRMPRATRDLIRSKDRSVRWVEVTATEGKQTRAEPISALYEQGRVHHVVDPADPDKLARLEDEMISWDPQTRMPSPNRMDALVWLLTALMQDWLEQKRPLAYA